MSIDPDVILGKKELILKISAIGLPGAQYNSFLHEYEVDINVSLNQHGFPVDNMDFHVLNASPLIIDLDGGWRKKGILGGWERFFLGKIGRNVVFELFFKR